MLSDPRVALEIIELCVRVRGELDSSIGAVRDRCTAEEFSAYRRSIGRVMAELITEIENPLAMFTPLLRAWQMAASENAGALPMSGCWRSTK